MACPTSPRRRACARHTSVSFSLLPYSRLRERRRGLIGTSILSHPLNVLVGQPCALGVLVVDFVAICYVLVSTYRVAIAVAVHNHERRLAETMAPPGGGDRDAGGVDRRRVDAPATRTRSEGSRGAERHRRGSPSSCARASEVFAAEAGKRVLKDDRHDLSLLA